MAKRLKYKRGDKVKIEIAMLPDMDKIDLEAKIVDAETGWKFPYTITITEELRIREKDIIE